jgi:hypothetical protein
MQVTCKVTGKITSTELLSENVKTIIVKLPDGNIVKRHKQKHCVSPLPFMIDGHAYCQEITENSGI